MTHYLLDAETDAFGHLPQPPRAWRRIYRTLTPGWQRAIWAEQIGLLDADETEELLKTAILRRRDAQIRALRGEDG